jgi:hypothetical protein
MRCSRTQSSRASSKLPIGWDLFPASLFCLARHGRVHLCKSFPVRSYPGGRPKRFHPAAHPIEEDLVADVQEGGLGCRLLLWVGYRISCSSDSDAEDDDEDNSTRVEKASLLRWTKTRTANEFTRLSTQATASHPCCAGRRRGHTSERIQKTENPGNGFKPLLRRVIYNPLNNRVS